MPPSADRTSTPRIVVDNPDSPNHPSEVLLSQSRENSLEAQDDNRAPLLNNSNPESNRETKRQRWRDCTRQKRNVIVGLLTIALMVMIIMAFISRTLLDKESSARGANRKILVHAKHGAVATELDTCSNIGVNILREGGNAVDAAIASGICIGSINMFSAGIGG